MTPDLIGLFVHYGSNPSDCLTLVIAGQEAGSFTEFERRILLRVQCLHLIRKHLGHKTFVALVESVREFNEFFQLIPRLYAPDCNSLFTVFFVFQTFKDTFYCLDLQEAAPEPDP